MTLLTVSNISRKKGEDAVLKGISFVQQTFQKVAIAGETGSGKSTLLRIIAGLIQPDEGGVFLDDKKVLGPEEKLVPGHQAIGYLSQQYELRNAYRVEEILSYANMLSDKEADELYKICRITHLLKRRTDQLSGGEKQRIALARLLIGSLKLLLLDEPYSNLDMIHTAILKSVVIDIGEKMGITCLMVSHEPADILSWADEIFIMKDGAFVQRGSPVDIYRRPVSEYVAGLFGSYNLLGLDGERQLFLRPEDLRIGSSGMEGRVVEILFFGSYYEVKVLLGQQVLVVRVQEVSFVVGDIIVISISENAEHFF